MNDFFSGLLVEIVGFALTSIAVYLIFERREAKKLEGLKKTVFVRLKSKIINPFISYAIANLRSDIVRPSAFASLLIKAPVASNIVKIEQLQEKLLTSFKNRDIPASFSVKNEQWKIIVSEDFLIVMKRIVGHWSSKQWKKYYELLERSLKQMRGLLDIYQSRLPPEVVSALIEYENKADVFTSTMRTFHEFYCRIDELEFPITSDFLANRKSFQYVTCESLHSIFKYIDELQKVLE